MPKATKSKKFYAVQKGRQTGIFLTWEDCEKQTKGYPGAKYQSFTNAADAGAYVSGISSQDPGTSAHPTSGPSRHVSSNVKGKKRAASKSVADGYEHDIVYCDGACKGNGKTGSIAGVGVWWEENDPRNIAERCPGDQTNNRAELIAIVRMLETTPVSKRTLLIKTDSQYCIKCFFQWLPKWRRNNFRTAGGDPVKNVEIIKYISALLEGRALVGQPVRMEYVKGHSDDRGNDGADAQANKGALLPLVPERDWAKAKQEFLKRLEEERGLGEDQPTSAPLGVNVGALEQSTNQPRKVRKISHNQPFPRLSLAPASMPNLEPLSTESSPAQVRSCFLPHTTSSTPPLPIVEVSSSSPRETVPFQAHPPSLPCNTDPVQPEHVKMVNFVDCQLSTAESSKLLKAPKIPVRKHGVGLFTTTPPPNAGFVMRFSTLPCELHETMGSEALPQGEEKAVKAIEEPMAVDVDSTGAGLNVKGSESVPQDQEKTEKPMAMSVNAAEVDHNNAQELGPMSKDIMKPIAMSVDVADVDLNDYLDCVNDDDPFDDV